MEKVVEKIVGEAALTELYHKMVACGRHEVFLYTDSSLSGWLEWIAGGWVYGCYVDGELIGFQAFTDFEGYNAFTHFCMFGIHDELTVDFGLMIYRAVFGLYGDEGLLRVWGKTPCCYRHAMDIVHGVGMRDLATIPKSKRIRGKLRDVLLTSITKQEFIADELARGNVYENIH